MPAPRRPRTVYTPIQPARVFPGAIVNVRGEDPAIALPFELVVLRQLQTRKGHRSLRVKQAHRRAVRPFFNWWRRWGTVPAGSD